ncbi:MAG: hypothetical protein J7K68_05580 [Candidatus Diapherotrites archaeon]|nr:hypothetical protein [Candidatus Diapherotrites archaeon]
MTMEDEVKTTYKMLKENNFKVAEIIFEGGISVKDTQILATLQKLVDEGKAFGIVHVIYLTQDGQQRVIDITAGKVPEQQKEELK